MARPGQPASDYARQVISGLLAHEPRRELEMQQQQQQQPQSYYYARALAEPPLDGFGEPAAAANASGAQLVQQVDQSSYGIVNVTGEYPFEYARIMFGYIMPFVLVITLITNLLVIVVLSRRHMRTPTNIVLMTMAIVDIGTIASPSPWYLYIYTFGNHDKPLFPPATCYAHYVMTDVIPIFLHTSSIWLALLLASQRYIYVCHPTMARTWCTVPRVKRAIFAILLVAFLHQLTHFFDNVYKPAKVELNNELHDACRNEMAGWVSEIGDNYYYLTYYTFRILFVLIIPCVALLTLNVLLFRALRRAERKRTELLKTRFKLVGVAEHQNNGGAGAGACCSTANRASQAGQSNETRASNQLSGAFEASSYALAAQAARQRDERAAVARGLFVREAAPSKAPTSTSAAAATPPLPLPPPPPLAQVDEGERARVARTTSRSDDNHSCPSVSEISERRPKAALGGQRRRPQRHARSVDLEGAAQPGRSPSTGSAEEEDEEEDESTCAECAAYAERPHSSACRRCSADELEARAACERLEKCDGRRRQPISQCSSVLGHNGGAEGPRKSAGAAPDGARDSDDLDGADQEQNLSIGSASGDSASGPRSSSLKLTSGGGGEGDKRPLAAPAAAIGKSSSSGSGSSSSSSAGSRLACSCLKAAAVQARSLRRVRLLAATRSKLEARRLSQAAPTICATMSSGACKRASCQQQQQQRVANALLQVRGRHQTTTTTTTLNDSTSRRTSDSLAGRMKSPSFASSIGRGSRATLLMGAPSGGGAHMNQLALPPAPPPPPLGGHAPPHASQSGRTMDSNRTTLMLIVVVTVFLVVEVPVAAVTITHVVLNVFDVFQHVDLISTLNYIKLFTNFFIMISYSINFTIYCSMSKKFRETFRDLFLCGRAAERKRAKRMLYQTQAEHSRYITNTNHQQQQQQQFASPTSFGGGGAGGEPRQRAASNATATAAAAAPVAARNAKLKLITRANCSGASNNRAQAPAEVTDGLQRNSALQSDYLATARVPPQRRAHACNGHGARHSHDSSGASSGWPTSSSSSASSPASSAASSAPASPCALAADADCRRASGGVKGGIHNQPGAPDERASNPDEQRPALGGDEASWRDCRLVGRI